MLYKNMANILHDRRHSYEVLHYTTVLGSYAMSKFDQYGNELIVGLQPTLDSDGKLCVLPEPLPPKHPICPPELLWQPLLRRTPAPRHALLQICLI